MRLLVDTHALIWWLLEDPRLSGTAYAALADRRNVVFVSAISLCEIAIKLSIHKLPAPDGFNHQILGSIAASAFRPLPVTLEHAYGVRWLPWHHRDPFDRVLVAQSLSDGLIMVTNDAAIRRYQVDCLW